eukprot:6486855-Amphidinium_carterae.1
MRYALFGSRPDPDGATADVCFSRSHTDPDCLDHICDVYCVERTTQRVGDLYGLKEAPRLWEVQQDADLSEIVLRSRVRFQEKVLVLE